MTSLKEKITTITLASLISGLFGWGVSQQTLAANIARVTARQDLADHDIVYLKLSDQEQRTASEEHMKTVIAAWEHRDKITEKLIDLVKEQNALLQAQNALILRQTK